MRGSKGPYGGGTTVIMPGAETPTGGGRGSKETWADVTENVATRGQEGWQEDHRSTLAQWKTHQPEVAEGTATPSTPMDYMASMNAMMKAMAQEQNVLRERVESEKAAREQALAVQEGMNQTMHQLAQMIMEIKKGVTSTRARADSRSRDKSTSRTFRRSDSVRGRKEKSHGVKEHAEDKEIGVTEPSVRRQRTQLEDGEDRKMVAASVSSASE